MINLADRVTATGAQPAQGTDRVAYGAGFQVFGNTTSGTGTAAVNLEVSIDGTHWLVHGTVSLTLGTTDTTDGFAVLGLWPYARANVTGLTGTGANVTAILNG